MRHHLAVLLTKPVDEADAVVYGAQTIESGDLMLRTGLGRRVVASAIAVATIGLILPASEVSAATYSISSAATGGDRVKMRDQPTGASTFSGYANPGSTFDVVCQQWGEAQGTRGNTLWFKVNGSGRNGWWINDTWTTSPHLAADKTVGVPGIAWCGATPPPPPPPPPPPGGSVNTAVWIGAPFAGFYRTATRPGVHGGNQVAFDYYTGGAAVTAKIYAAPKNTALDNRITAHITASEPGSGNATKCGYYAVVEIRDNGVAVGRVTFSHLAAKAPLGQIARYGGVVGKVATNLPLNQPEGSCYQVTNYAGGVHTHIEFRSYGTRSACAQDYGPASGTSTVSKAESNFQGYLGDYGKAPLAGKTCPAGI